MKELTKAEEQVMHYLWNIEKGFLKDIVDQFPEPKPAYTTISTVIRVLVKKGFIGFNTYGKINEYYPNIKKQEYFGSHFKGLLKNYFSSSHKNFISFFTKDKDLNIQQLEEIKKVIEEQINKQKENSSDV